MYRFLLLLIVITLVSCKETVSSKSTLETENEVVTTTPVHVEEEKVLSNDRYVIAFNGLTMRNKPDLFAEKVGKLTYREEIEVIEEKASEDFTINDRGFKINGRFVKIKRKNTGQEAYVFDGFLKSSEQIQDSYDYYERTGIETSVELYSVYTLEKGLTGIVIPINEGDSTMQYYDEDIDNSLYSENEELRWEYLLHKSLIGNIHQTDAVLEQFQHYIGNSYFLQGVNANGKTAVVTDVGVHIDECSSHFLFLQLDNEEDLSDYYFAGKQAFDLVRNQKDLDEKTSRYNYYESITRLHADCVLEYDNGYITFIGTYNGKYLGYREAVQLPDSGIIDPFRTIVGFKDHKIELEHLSFLDMFGCACL